MLEFLLGVYGKLLLYALIHGPFESTLMLGILDHNSIFEAKVLVQQLDQLCFRYLCHLILLISMIIFTIHVISFFCHAMPLPLSLLADRWAFVSGRRNGKS